MVLCGHCLIEGKCLTDCGRILVKGIPDRSHDQILTMVEQCHTVILHNPLIKLQCSQTTFLVLIYNENIIMSKIVK